MTPLKYKNEIVEHEELLSGFSAPVTNSVKPRWQRKKEKAAAKAAEVASVSESFSMLNNSINNSFNVSQTPRKRNSSHVATPRSKKRARPSSKSSMKKKGSKHHVMIVLFQIVPQQM